MIQSTKDTQTPASSRPEGVDTVPASWPIGVSSLAQAVDACQRADAHEASSNWQARAPKAVQPPPGFRRNAAGFARDKAAKERG